MANADTATANPTQAERVADDELGVPYQVAGQVRQALGELRNAEGTGNTERAKAARKTLIALGYEPPAAKSTDADAEQSPKAVLDARKQPPEGRSATPPQSVRANVATAAVGKSPAGP